jgi:hypothetical protein
MNSKYSNSKIYRLVCEDGHYYYGSTIMRLCERLWSHKDMCVKRPDLKVYKHILSIGWDKVKIELIKEVVCETKRDLLILEDEYIRLSITDALCLNHRVSHRTDEEKKRRKDEDDKKYREQHREERNNYSRKWRQNKSIVNVKDEL